MGRGMIEHLLRFCFRLPGVLAAPLLLVACGPAPDDSSQGAPLVLAASSLQEALDEAADEWAAQGHPRPVLSFAATAALARQVDAGAPADLLISADEAWMDELEQDGHLRAGTRADLAGNRLVLIAPAASTATLALQPGMDLAALLGPDGRLALAEPETVPAGRYGRAALESLGAWSQVSTRLAIAENVRAALALVSRGEAALGVVYTTDAMADAQVRVVATFPDSSHPRIVYPLAVLARSTHAQTADFADWLRSPAGQAVLRKHGFAPPPEA